MPHFDAIPESAPSCKAPQSFSRENAARWQKLWRVWQKRRNTLPAQNQRQAIKVWHVSYQKEEHKFILVLRSFDVRILYTVGVVIYAGQKFMLIC